MPQRRAKSTSAVSIPGCDGALLAEVLSKPTSHYSPLRSTMPQFASKQCGASQAADDGNLATTPTKLNVGDSIVLCVGGNKRWLYGSPFAPVHRRDTT